MRDVDDSIFEYQSRGMISGQGEAQDRTYEMHVGKSGCAWFVPSLQTNKADNILRTAYDDWDKRGEGFGGSTLLIHLQDGSNFYLHGGWHTNAQGLLADTGVDVTQTHLTYGAFGLSDPGGWMRVSDLLYRDEEPTLGLYHRIELAAYAVAKATDQKIRFVNQGHGGGSAGWVNPDSQVMEW